MHGEMSRLTFLSFCLHLLSVFTFCCLFTIIGEVKEEDDEEDGRASPPPFQPGPSYSDRVTSVGVTLPPMTGTYFTTIPHPIFTQK